GFGGSISGKVFDRSRNAVRLGQIVLLITANIGARHRRSEIWVFASALCCAPPPRIARDIDHRRVEPANARSCCFFSGHVTESSYEIRIECRCKPQRLRINRAEAMNDICAKEQRNMQTALFDCGMLKCIRALRAYGVEHGAEASGS